MICMAWPRRVRPPNLDRWPMSGNWSMDITGITGASFIAIAGGSSCWSRIYQLHPASICGVILWLVDKVHLSRLHYCFWVVQPLSFSTTYCWSHVHVFARSSSFFRQKPVRKPYTHWIGLRNNLQETTIFNSKNHGFLFPWNQSNDTHQHFSISFISPGFSTIIQLFIW
jgi:hypothetical protein